MQLHVGGGKGLTKKTSYTVKQQLLIGAGVLP